MRLLPLDTPYVLVAAALLAGCTVGPTQADIERDLEAQLSSAVGGWTGAAGDGSLSLAFRLDAAGAGQLGGSGTMQERGVGTSRAVTVSGNYQRPVLDLVFDGLVYEGRAVRATFRGSYTSVGGIADTLTLTGTGYSKRLGILLQESSP